MVKSTAWPPGSTCGQRCAASPGDNFVRAAGGPPPSETRINPEVPFKDAMICPSGPQATPRGTLTGASVIAPPPSREIFLSAVEVNPTHFPSGEKNGELAPRVSGSSTALARGWSRRSMNKEVLETYTIREPSGER